MIELVAAVLVSLVFYAGGVFNDGHMFAGLLIASLSVTALGTLFAAVRYAGQRVSSFDTREGLSLAQLHKFLSEQPALTGDTKIFVGDQGLNMAGSVFVCILDGHRRVVIERQVIESVAPPAAHDLF